MKVCFIDDCFSANGNKDRVDKIKLLAARDEINVHQVLPSDIRNWYDDNPGEMDLIFIDYKLQEDQATNAIFRVGSEMVSLVRKLFPDTPIYLLSVEIEKSKEFERAEGFERTVGENYLSKTDNAYLDIKEHVALKSFINARDIESLINAGFKAPVEVKTDLQNAIPGSIKKFLSLAKDHNTFEKSYIGARVEMYRWFIDFFYRYPGFLLNEDACALYLGISVDYFRKISEKLSEAVYDGIFASTFERRWWKSKIEDIVIASDKEDLLGSTHFCEVSSTIFNASLADRATCAFCGQGIPEELAITDDTTDSTLLMVHTRCSRLDIDFNVGPYFTKPRIVDTQ